MTHAFPPTKVLVACDFSSLGRGALAYGAELAQETDAELILVHVAEPISPDLPPGAKPTPARMRELLADRNGSIRDQLAEDMAVAAKDFTNWSDVVADGEPADTIARVAMERNCDLIVLGSHGRSGVQRLLLGSVAEGVMRRAHCPVLVSR